MSSRFRTEKCIVLVLSCEVPYNTVSDRQDERSDEGQEESNNAVDLKLLTDKSITDDSNGTLAAHQSVDWTTESI